jgi:serine/threonine-protein kinase
VDRSSRTRLDVQVGTIIAGKYRIERVVGAGGMGIVHLATHLRVGERVALKVLRSDVAMEPTSVLRFLGEARAAMRMRSPHIVRVFDVDMLDGAVPYIVMEYLSGRDLAKVLGDGPIPPPDACEYVLQACEAVAEAHAAGIVHRDIKPGNLFLTRWSDGTPCLKLLDFGISKFGAPADLEAPQTQRTGAGAAARASTGAASVLGTPGYMAPEQVLASARVDERADLWSLGVVLYELLSARAPFSGADATEVRRAVMECQAPSLRLAQPGVPQALEAAVMRCLRRDPAERFANVAELAEAIAPFAHPRAAASAVRARSVLEAEAGEPTSSFRRANRPEEKPPTIETTGAQYSEEPVVGSLPGPPHTGDTADSPKRPARHDDGHAPRVRRRVWWLAMGALVAAIAGAGGVAVQPSGPAKSSTPAGATSATEALVGAPTMLEPSGFRRITFDPGCEEFPSFTPDGSALVFDGSDGPDSSLFLLSLADLSRRRLTRTKGWDFAPAVSPDGKQVAFLRSTPEAHGAFVLPIDATPETPAHFITSGSLRPSWSPDSTTIWAGDHGRFTQHAVSDGHLTRTLDIAAGYIGGQSSELPDGRLVVTYPFLAEAAAGAVGVYGTDGAFRKLLDGNIGEVLAILPSGRSALVVRKAENGVPTPLAVPLDGSPAVSLAPSGILPYKGLAISSDGKRLVYSTCRGGRNILRVGPDGLAVPLTPAAEWEDTDIASIPGTRRLAVVSERSGQAQVWIVDKTGDPVHRLVTPELVAQDVATSPDGAWVATSTPKGIWLLAVDDGRPPRQLTSDPSDYAADFDTKGEHVLFTREGQDKVPVVMSVPFGGGEPQPFLGRGSRQAHAIAGDRIVYLRGTGDKDTSVVVFDPKSGVTRPLSRALAPGGYANPQPSPDGRRVAVVRSDLEVVEVDVATGSVLRTFAHAGDQFSRVAYSGSDLLIVRALWAGDLWLADLR